MPRVGDRIDRHDGLVEVHSHRPTRDLQSLTSWAVERDLELEELTLAPPSFEDADGLATIGWIFPFKHLVHANEAAYTTTTIAPGHLGVVALWGAAAAAIAAWRLRSD